jgi:hypothetical protein
MRYNFDNVGFLLKLFSKSIFWIPSKIIQFELKKLVKNNYNLKL